MNLLTYSNGYGHLIMSIFMTLVGLALILIPGVNSGAQGVGIGIILAVQAAWFVPGAAKQVATEVIKQMNTIPAGPQGIQGPQGAPGTPAPAPVVVPVVVQTPAPVVTP